MHSSAEKPTSEDQEVLLENVEGFQHWSSTAKAPIWSKVAIAILSLLLGLSLLTHPLFKTPSLGEREKDKICSVHTAVFPSPVENDLDITWKASPVNGSFDKLSIYRRPASPDVDQAWTDLGADLKPFIIPEDEAEKYGLHPGQVKRIPEQGGGYVAILESTHHLHCLNVLRQGSHFDYPYYRALGLESGRGVFADTEDWVRLHLSHCLEMLRQRLMCTADTNVCGQVWVEDYGPLVFANVDRKCRNYDEITQWARDHQLLPVEDILVKKRPGDLIYESFP
jgi:hypothetical protein